MCASYKCRRFAYVHIFVFFLAYLPAVSTLFPYTTLFRSGVINIMGRVFMLPIDDPFAVVLREIEAHDGKGIVEDRKSTRLNSSHLGISYAVFCLKKKNGSTVRPPSTADCDSSPRYRCLRC